MSKLSISLNADTIHKEVDSPCAQLDKLLFESGMKVKFGLRAQGHIPTIERMLAEGATWDEIGKVIGWHPPTAKEWYEREVKREGERG